MIRACNSPTHILLTLFIWSPGAFGEAPLPEGPSEDVMRVLRDYGRSGKTTTSVDDLRRLGILAPVDLAPYLHLSPPLRIMALRAIGDFPQGQIDVDTSEIIDALAANAPDSPTRSWATKVALRHRSRQAGLAFAESVVDQVNCYALLTVFSWLTVDRESLDGDPRAARLMQRCFQRLEVLLSQDCGPCPATLQFVFTTRPIFLQHYSEEVVRAYLVAAANGDGVDGWGWSGVFLVLKTYAEIVPDVVEEGLVRIIENSPPAMAKVHLYYMAQRRFLTTDMGARIARHAVAGHPSVAPFLRLLRESLPYGDPELRQEVGRAFEQLKSAANETRDTTRAKDDGSSK